MLKKAIIFFVALALLAPSAFAVTLTGDFDGDGVITLSDLTYFLLQFRHAKAGTSWDAAANVDGNAGLTRADASLMIDDYLREQASTPLLAFYSNRPGGTGDYDIYLYNRRTDGFLPVPGLNTSGYDYVPSLSADGRYIVSQGSNHGTVGGLDVYLYDRDTASILPLPGLNSTAADVVPSASAYASYIVFQSDRAVGMGGQDIYLYDRNAAALVALPGLNSTKDDTAPCISANGRWIVFVTRTDATERDIMLYDRDAGALVDTSALNSATTDFNPSISGDGKLIAFASNRGGGAGAYDIYLYNRTTSSFVAFSLNSALTEWDPVLSPDGRTLAFTHGDASGDFSTFGIFFDDTLTNVQLSAPGINSAGADILRNW